MPAPAVIPAPRAYINAVAVKGFVVELRAVQSAIGPRLWRPDLRLCQSVNIRNTYRGIVFPSNHACNVCRRAPVFFTVTKKARPKQSFDMDLKAWDNEAAAYRQPLRLLLVLNVCGRLWIRTTGGSGYSSPRSRG